MAARQRTPKATRPILYGSLFLGLWAGCGDVNPAETTQETKSAIINGTVTTERPEVGSIGCTATLIAPNYFISAAHCFCANGRQETQGQFTIDLAVPPGSPPEKAIYNYDVVYSLNGHIDFGCALGNDEVAIGHLTTSVDANTAKPAILADRQPQPGDSVTEFGYGCTDLNDVHAGTGVKRKASFTWEWLPPNNRSVSCPGDSGGPVFLNDSAGKPTGELIAINSSHGPPDGYTRPSGIKATIEALIRSLEGGTQEPFESGVRRSGNNMPNMPLTSVQTASDCRAKCAARPECRAFTHDSTTRTCNLKDAVPTASTNQGTRYTSGVMLKGLEPEWDRPGTALSNGGVVTKNSATECRDTCSRRSDCLAFSYQSSNKTCKMMGYVPKVIPTAGFTSGLRLTQSTFDIQGGTDIGSPLSGSTADRCEAACATNASCVGYTYRAGDQSCRLKSSLTGSSTVSDINSMSGLRRGWERAIERKFAGDAIATITGVANVSACDVKCVQNKDCRAFTYFEFEQKCSLWGSMGQPVPAGISVSSGLRRGIEVETDRPGNDFSHFDLQECFDPPNCDSKIPYNPIEQCQSKCEGDSRCKAWTLVSLTNGAALDGTGHIVNHCWLKDGIPERVTRRLASSFEAGMNRPGHNIGNPRTTATSAQDCQRLCFEEPACRAFTFTADPHQPTKCQLKWGIGEDTGALLVPTPNTTSGIMYDAYGTHSGRKGMFSF